MRLALRQAFGCREFEIGGVKDQIPCTGQRPSLLAVPNNIGTVSGAGRVPRIVRDVLEHPHIPRQKTPIPSAGDSAGAAEVRTLVQDAITRRAALIK